MCQLFLQLLLTVAQVGCVLKVLALYGGILLLVYCVNEFLLFFNLLWNNNVCYVLACTRLVHCVNGLVGETTVGYVAVCQFDTRKQRLVSVCDIVVVLVTLLYVLQYHKSVLNRCRLNKHLLETALKRTVLLNSLAVLVNGCGANALYLSACKRWLQYVGSIH